MTAQTSAQAKLELARTRKALKARLRLAFDGMVPESAPTPTQDGVLRDAASRIFWILGGNRSGKTALGGRITSWWFNNDHPFMPRPERWGAGPLQILVVGRLLEQIESEIWERKIKPFLNEADCQVVRVGGSLQRVINRRNGNRIIFLSHHDAERAREKAQAFTSHVVWLDEMPDDAGIVTELVFRTLSNEGRLYATFTPLLRNEEIRKVVDSQAPGMRKIQLSMLDNPVYRGREEEVEAQVRAVCNSEAEFRARMYGDWYYGDTRVVAYDRTRNRRALPDHYHPRGWRHLAVLDPAASGMAGLTVWGEDPKTGHWFNVKSLYLKGAAATDLLMAAETAVEPWQGPGLVRRCDCNPAGFYREAARQHVPWIPFTDKNDRKLETLNNLNESFLKRTWWLTEASGLLEEEVVKCSWSERDPSKIANASKYHLLDSTRYARDCAPVWDPKVHVPMTPTQEIRKAWKERTARVVSRTVQRRSRWTRPLAQR